VLCVPLKYKDEIIGVVYVDNRLRSGVFEEREKNLMLAFANQAAVAIENARLYERIQRSLNEIREVKELLDGVFASIGSGVITANYENNIMDFNRAAGEILQRDVEQALGAKLATVLSGVSADLEAHLVTVRENRNSQVLEAEMEIGSRGRVALNMKVSPLQDKVRGTQGIAMVLDDVTAQRGREEMLTVMKRYLPPEMVDNIHTISKLDLGGVRHEVTCMFVDVRPVDTFPEGFRPQQIMEELNIYFACATDVIHAAKGVIDKYMGTEIMALFNTQLNPMPNHAQIALEVALSIREALTALYDELGIDPQPHYYRVGIHSGVATLGNVGSLNRREFTAIGDTINLTKRLEENASAGQIIVSEHVQQKLATADVSKIRFEERDPLKVKGRQQKTRIYEVFRA